MLLPIRYSPSGPIIRNAAGGDAVPGEGFRLRLSEVLDSQGALTLSGTPQDMPSNGADFIATLANPKPGLRYRASAQVNLTTTGAGGKQVLARFAWNAGNGWVNGPAFQVVVGATDNSFSLVLAESVLTLGSALPDPVTEASTQLQVRLTLEGTDTISVAGQSMYLGLTETL